MCAAKNTTDSKPLKRGRACLTCRFLKIKCDGARPICGPCLHHPKDDECEFADSPRRSRTKQLEDQVARLEARLRDIEHPEPSASSSLLLRQPYGTESSQPPIASASSSLWTQSLASPHSAGPSPLVDTPPGIFETSTRRAESPQFTPDEPPIPLARNFIEIFARYASDVGFFLNYSRFLHSAKLALPMGHDHRPCPSVLSAVYLWGCHLAEQHSPIAHSGGSQHHYLTVALKNAATGLTSTHSDRHLHTIQAEILLTYYFLRIGNLLEARRHSSSALSLAIGCGLHRTRSEYSWPHPRLSTAGDNGIIVTLPPPANTIEEGERIDGFWQVVILCKTLAVALEVPAEVCGQLEAAGFAIDTPWPLTQAQYEDGILPPPSTSTIGSFLRQTIAVDNTASLLALTAQAAVVLHQITYFTGQWSMGRNTQGFPTTYQTFNQLIVNLRHALPPLTDGKSSSLFHAHALVLAASIRLNDVAAASDFGARQESVTAALSMVRWSSALLKDPTCTNPITGTLLSIACQALIDEIVRLRNHHQLIEESKEFTSASIDEALRLGMQVLYLFSGESPLMRYQLTNMQALYSAL